MSEKTAGSRDQIGELAESFVARYRAGERPSIEEFVRKYPDVADELRQLLPALVLLEQHASIAGNGGAPGRATALDRIPREIGEFTILREIGRGGMGVVYEAVQQSLGRHVALKVLSSVGLLNPTHLERFRLEARAAGRLHHSHIVPVFGVGEVDGLHYYAMQFIPGQSLDQVIDALRKVRPTEGAGHSVPTAKEELTHSIAGGLLSGQVRSITPVDGLSESDERGSNGVGTQGLTGHSSVTTQNTTGQFSSGSSGRPFYESVARVGLQVAEALAYAHAEGILHRDIKPSNLLIDAKGNAWVTDFGLVKAEDTQSLTDTGDLVGTLRYMAPERLEGWSDRRSDIYGLGVSLYELVTLRTFFEGANRGQLIDHIRHKQPQAPTKIDPAIPRDLETIILKALAKDPGSRYHTADEVSEDLRRFLADRPILARRTTYAEQFARWCRRNPLVASLTATAAAALLLGTIVSTWQAVRATRAERLAQSRFETELKARKEADRARSAESEQRELAERQRAEAEKQRTIAEANYQKAKAAVDEQFTMVSESTLFNTPGLEPVRGDLLQAATRYYKDFAEARAGDPMASADLAAMYLRLGTVYIALNRSDDFLVAIKHALEVIEQMQRDHPDGGDHERRLAGFWHGARWAQVAVSPPRDMAAAFQTGVRLENTWRKFAEKYPTEIGFQSDLAQIQASLGMALSTTNRFELGFPYFRKARTLIEKLIAEHPDVPLYRDDLVFYGSSEVNYLKVVGKLDDALPLARRCVEVGEGLIAEYPDVFAYRTHYAGALGQLAGVLAATDINEAAKLALRTLDLKSAIALEFPEYPGALLDWTGTAIESANKAASHAGGEWSNGQVDDAARHYEQAVQALEPLERVRPDHVCLLLADRMIDLARVLAYGGHTPDAAATRARCIRVARLLDDRLDQEPVKLAMMAVALRAYAERLEQETAPEADVVSIIEWSTPFVERTIRDGELLDALISKKDAHWYDRQVAADAQRWLAKILVWTDRPAQSVPMWLRAVDSYEMVAHDHPDRRGHVQYVLEDCEPQLKTAIDMLVEHGHAEEAKRLLREIIERSTSTSAEKSALNKIFSKSKGVPEAEQAIRQEIVEKANRRLAELMAKQGKVAEAATGAQTDNDR